MWRSVLAILSRKNHGRGDEETTEDTVGGSKEKKKTEYWAKQRTGFYSLQKDPEQMDAKLAFLLFD